MSSTIVWTSGWFVVMALQICLRMVVLPLRGGETINPRVPLPIGVTRSIMRVSIRSGLVSRLNFSIGSMVVRFSKRTALVYSSNGMSLTFSTVLSCGLVPRCGGWVTPATWLPSRKKLRRMVSGVTKMSVGFG